MTALNLSTTAFEFNNHGSKEIYSSIVGDYTFHSIEAWNNIIINGNEYQVMYQTGHEYICNQYSCPSNDMIVYDEGSSHLCNILNEMYESDLEDKERSTELLEEIQVIEPAIDDLNKLHDLYIFFNDNKPQISDFIEL
jgi:hypothetical protein